MRPGEIYWAELDVGRHPILIVSRELLNRGATVVALLITTSKFALRSKLPNCIVFRSGEFGLHRDCVALGESIGPIPVDIIRKDEGPIGALPDGRLREAIRAIGYVIDAECEPM